MTTIALRDGTIGILEGRGIFGNILVGTIEGRAMSWRQSGSWRWDDQEHPNDIAVGLPDPLPRGIFLKGRENS